MKVTIHKALTAAAVILVVGIGHALQDGGLTVAEVLVALGEALVAGGAVWRVPYYSGEGRHREETVYGVPRGPREG